MNLPEYYNANQVAYESEQERYEQEDEEWQVFMN